MKHRSKVLGTYLYDPETGMLTFTDGVRYTLTEAMRLARGRLSDYDIGKIHEIKKLFDGEILGDPPDEGKYRMQEIVPKMRDLETLQNVRTVRKPKKGRPCIFDAVQMRLEI
jgi:hypothetical protein